MKKNFFENVIYLVKNILGHWEKKLLAVWQKPSGRFVETAFYVSIGKLRWKSFNFSTKSFFDIFLEHWAKIFHFLSDEEILFFRKKLIFIHHIGTLSKKLLDLKKFFWQVCQNFISIVLGNNLEKLIFLERKTIFVSFPVWQKFPDRVVKTAFCVFKETNRGKVIFSKKVVFKSVGDVEKIVVGISFWNCWQGCQNSILHVHRIVLKKIKFVKSFLFWAFLAFVRKRTGILLEKIQWSRSNCLLFVHMYLWSKTNWLNKVYTIHHFPQKIREKTSLFLSKTFQRGRQKCNLQIHRNILKRNESLKNPFFSNQFCPFSEKIPAFCQQLFSAVNQTQF